MSAYTYDELEEVRDLLYKISLINPQWGVKDLGGFNPEALERMVRTHIMNHTPIWEIRKAYDRLTKQSEETK